MNTHVGSGESLLLGKGEKGAHRPQPGGGVGEGNAQAIGVARYVVARELSHAPVRPVPADELVHFGLLFLPLLRREAGQVGGSCFP